MAGNKNLDDTLFWDFDSYQPNLRRDRCTKITKIYVEVLNTSFTEGITFPADELKGFLDYLNLNRCDFFRFKNSRNRIFKTQVKGQRGSAEFQDYYRINPGGRFDLIEIDAIAEAELLNNVFRILINARKCTKHKLVFVVI
jgi:hypothetical protein